MRPILDRLAENHRRKIGPILFLASLVLYVLTMSRYAAPGPFARHIVEQLGLFPFPPLSRFLWGVALNILAAIPLGATVLKLNLFSAVCGAASVWLMFTLVSRIPRDRTAEEAEARFPMEGLQVLSGIVAAVFLAVCTPFWVVSNRTHPASFDTLMLLFTVWLTVRFLDTKKLGWGCLSALFFALGLTQFATFVLLVPIYGLLMAYILWRSGLFRTQHIVVVVLCALAGLLPYFLGALRYALSPAFEWREFGSYWKVLWYVFREQYLELRFSVPQVGWLLVLMVNLVPWLIVIAFPKRAMTRSTVFSSNVLHALLGVLACLILFNVPIAPWPLLGTRPLLVMPYVLTAMWAGYIAGYWYLFFYVQSRFEIKGRANIRAIGRGFYLPLLAVVLVSAAAWNWRESDARGGDPVSAFAQAVVEDLDGREWLISNGVLDDVIVLLAAEQRVPVQVVNATQAGGAYLRYLASKFEEPRLKGLAQVGLGPLLAEWFISDTTVTGAVAVLSVPDLWTAEGLLPVPDRTMFRGVRSDKEINPESYFARQKEMWDTLGKEIAGAASRRNPAQPWIQWLQTHISKVANNAGVLLEDLQRKDLAFEAYSAARDLDTNNISALLNMLDLAHADARPEKAALEAEFEVFVGKLRSRLRLWSLAQHYGYVRRPEAFTSRGWAWAMSGKPGAGMKEIERAMASGASRQQVERTMAAIYFMQRMDAEGEQIYLSILEKDPKDLSAIVGLLHLAIRNGDIPQAAQYLARLREAGAPEDLVAMEEAAIEILDGNAPIAEEVLLGLVKRQPKNFRAWSLLTLISENAKVVDDANVALAAGNVRSPDVLLIMAHAALRRRDPRSAREYLEQILQVQPASVQALETLLGLDVAESRRDLAELHLEQLLRLDPRNAQANYVLGTIQYARGEVHLAEASYRASIAAKPSAEALNDLAWIVQRKGNFEEALELVRRSLEMNANSAPAWDTMGVILLELGRMEEAKQALDRALAIRPGAAALVLHMAQYYRRMGMVAEARELADPLMARAVELQPDEYDELRKLMEQLRLEARAP